MSAIVVFTDGDPWFANSYTWNIILERAKARIDSTDREKYDWFLNEMGLDFPSVAPAKRIAVAQMMIEVIEGLRSKTVLKDGDDSPPYEDLVRKLRNELQID